MKSPGTNQAARNNGAGDNKKKDVLPVPISKALQVSCFCVSSVCVYVHTYFPVLLSLCVYVCIYCLFRSSSPTTARAPPTGPLNTGTRRGRPRILTPLLQKSSLQMLRWIALTGGRNEALCLALIKCGHLDRGISGGYAYVLHVGG